MSRWSISELAQLRELYPKFGAKIAAEQLGRSINSVNVKANRIGLIRPHNTLDDTYFESIDSREKAYWLGFITADGYVENNSVKRKYSLGIELSSIDESHLHLFAKCLSSDAKITCRTRNLSKQGYDSCVDMSAIRVYSKSLVRSLAQYGVIPNKTDLLSQIPDINPEYIWDYIRGYFDGDGTFSYTNVTSTSGVRHQYGRIGFVCNSFDFLNDLKLIMERYGIVAHINADKSGWVLQIRKTESVKQFCSLIYNDQNCIKLDRKYQKYKDFYNV